MKDKKIIIPEYIEINFNSISKLKGNKIVLEYLFQIIKKELTWQKK